MNRSLLGTVIGFSALCALSWPYWTKDVYTVTVTDKIVKNDTYMIYTDHGAFKMEDTIAYFRWNTSDEYGKIKKNTEYSLQAYGVRVPFFSVYENITTATEIK